MPAPVGSVACVSKEPRKNELVVCLERKRLLAKGGKTVILKHCFRMVALSSEGAYDNGGALIIIIITNYST